MWSWPFSAGQPQDWAGTHAVPHQHAGCGLHGALRGPPPPGPSTGCRPCSHTATVPGEALRQSRWDLGPSCPGAEVTRRNSAAVCLLEASHCGRHIRGEGTKQRAACFQTSASTSPQERAFGTGPQRAQNRRGRSSAWAAEGRGARPPFPHRHGLTDGKHPSPNCRQLFRSNVRSA